MPDHCQPQAHTKKIETLQHETGIQGELLTYFTMELMKLQQKLHGPHCNNRKGDCKQQKGRTELQFVDGEKEDDLEAVAHIRSQLRLKGLERVREATKEQELLHGPFCILHCLHLSQSHPLPFQSKF